MFCLSVDALITDVKSYIELDNVAKAINFKMKYIYNKHKRGEDIEESLCNLMRIFLPNIKRNEVFDAAVYGTLKATLYAMLEDKNINENTYNVNTLKDVLQFANLDRNDKRANILAYFKDKSKRCKELISVYVNNADTTAMNIICMLEARINIAIE